MKKMKPSVKAVLVPTLVLTSTAAITYAVPEIKSEKITDIGDKLKLEVERVDGDTVKVSIDNVQDIPKALQFSIKLDGVTLQDGQNSIKDLIETEVQARLSRNGYADNSNSILTDYTYNEVDNTIDVLITSENSLPKVGNKIEIFELDVKKASQNTTDTYKVLPNNEQEYKYVSSTNKEYDNLGVVHDDKEIAMTIAPTIESSERYVRVTEGETLTVDQLKSQLGVALHHEDGDHDLTLEILRDGKPITEFTETTPGLYDLELKAVKDENTKSEALTVQVNVVLDKVTELPKITRNGETLTDIRLDGGNKFTPLENVKAVDAKRREVKVEVKVDQELDLDPDQDTKYVLTYTATDIYGNKAEENITLTVIANKAPSILGVANRTLTVGDKFDPKEGVTVEDDRDEKVELKVDSDVNTKIPGTYKVSYSATDSGGKTTRVQITVTVNPKLAVINQVPVITATNQTIKVGDKFDPKAGVTAYDEEDKDITKDIKVETNEVNTEKPGTYKVVYKVTDSGGATATKEITVTVKSNVVLATSLTINNKDDNKVYVGGSKTMTASVDKAADIKDVEWKISDSSLVELKVTGNEATIVAKSQGEVTLTALTKDGSNLTDTMTINVLKFEDDSEVPAYVKEIIDTNVLTPISGLGSEESPLEFEVKAITIDKLNQFLDNLSALDYQMYSIKEDGGFTVYEFKIANKVRLFKSTNDVYMNIKVSNNLANANEINAKLGAFSNNGAQKPVNKKPTISIEGLNTQLTIGDTFNSKIGVTAYDEEDGDLTSSITVSGHVDTTKAGTYTLTYTVKDSQGEEVSIIVNIVVSEKRETPDTMTDEQNKGEKPVIKVTSSINVITVGEKFDPLAGISAYDKEDGDLTSSIMVSGHVDTTKAGSYQLTYLVKDKDGNVSTFIRTITVVENNVNTSRPQTGYSGMLGVVGVAMTVVGTVLLKKRKNK